MPELPDVVVYLEALQARIEGRVLEGVRLGSPFVLRSVAPPLSACSGRRVVGLRRLGKRIVIALDGDLFLVIHLMVAGRLRWKKSQAKIPGKLGLAAFDFESGTLLLTEAGSRKRASLHVAAGEEALGAHDRGGLEVLDADVPAFAEVLRRETHTLKRTLTDPRLLSGIGNAYSDEVLHRARLHPGRIACRLKSASVDRLHLSIRQVLEAAIEQQGSTFDGFYKTPEGKPGRYQHEFRVYGRTGKPCLRCGRPIRRIVVAQRGTHLCPRCQPAPRAT